MIRTFTIVKQLLGEVLAAEEVEWVEEDFVEGLVEGGGEVDTGEGIMRVMVVHIIHTTKEYEVNIGGHFVDIVYVFWFAIFSFYPFVQSTQLLYSS